MTEVLFILTTIFVAYVIYVVVNEQKAASKPQVPQAKPEKPVAAVKQPVPQSAPTNEKVEEPKPVAAVIQNPGPASAPQDAGKRGLKDPKTGEVTTAYSNYRFTKRWIKEALVAEGLVAKIYKNDELNADIEAQIKQAVLKLEAIDKYRV
jgi:hypothetical protein